MARLRTRNLRCADHIDRVAIGINDRRSCNSDFGIDFARTSAYVAPNHGYFATCAPMNSIEQVSVPECNAWIGVGIEGEECVVLGGDVNHIMEYTADAHARHPQGLCIDQAVYGTGEEFAEAAAGHCRSTEGILLRVCAVAAQIVVIREHALKVGHRDCGRGSAGRIDNTDRRDGMDSWRRG